jgi:hypothetical protein
VIVVFVAVIASAAFIIGCSSTDRAARDRKLAARDRQDRALAAQDRIVQYWNRVEAARAQVVAAKRKLAVLRADMATTEAMLSGIANDQQTLGYFGVSLEDLCARNGAKANKQALRYLNLSCPAPGRWRVNHPQLLPSNDLAVERRAVRLLNRIETAKARVARARRNLVHMRRAATIAQVALNKNPRAQHELRSFGFTFGNVCVSIVPNGSGPAQQQAQRVRETRRRQALRSLMVTCPSP